MGVDVRIERIVEGRAVEIGRLRSANDVLGWVERNVGVTSCSEPMPIRRRHLIKLMNACKLALSNPMKARRIIPSTEGVRRRSSKDYSDGVRKSFELCRRLIREVGTDEIVYLTWE